MKKPAWKRVPHEVKLPADHVSSETVYARRLDNGNPGAPVGATWQVVQSIMVTPTSGYERPGYRLIEIRVVAVDETLGNLRRRADERL